MGCSLCNNTIRIPELEASVLTTNYLLKFGNANTRADKRASMRASKHDCTST